MLRACAFCLCWRKLGEETIEEEGKEVTLKVGSCHFFPPAPAALVELSRVMTSSEEKDEDPCPWPITYENDGCIFGFAEKPGLADERAKAAAADKIASAFMEGFSGDPRTKE